MHNARIFAAYAVLSACGPTTVNVTTTGEGEGDCGGESSSGPDQDTSTTLGATSAPGTGGSSGTTGGEAAGDSTGSGTTGGECLPYEQADGSYACLCFGEWSDPSECGCVDVAGMCTCEGFEPSDLPCLVPPSEACAWKAEPPASCICDGVPSHPTECGCELTDGECICPDDPASYPAGMCTDDVCIVDQVTWGCFCDGSPVDTSACGCSYDPTIAACQCMGEHVDPSVCDCAVVDMACVCDDFTAPDWFCG